MKNIVVAIAVLVIVMPAMAQEKADAPKEGVALTVYNGNFAVVRDTRMMDIAPGVDVKFLDVARDIDATSVHFKSFTDPAAKLLEQNYQFDLVSADKLLQKYIDQPIEVVCKTGGKTYAGALMSFDGDQIVLKEDKGGLVMVQRPDNVQDIRFKALPEGLLTKPTLVWKVDTTKPGKQLAEVTYQTNNVTWHAEYVLVLTDNDTAADLSGWVSVSNNSGKTYKDALLKFIAGDVRHEQAQPRGLAAYGFAEKGGGEMPMEEKAFFEYHMYSLPRPSTVADNEVKQLEMFKPATGLKVEKKYLYTPIPGWRWYGSRNVEPTFGTENINKKVNVFIEFANTEANKLGIPLPAGKVRCFKQDPADKAMEFIGEQQIDHTARGEKLSLMIGNAFDIVGERKQTDFKSDTGRKRVEESFKITIKNSKKEEVTVRVKEPMYRWNQWKITESNEKHEKLDAFHEVWDVKVPPMKDDKQGETVVTYTVEYTW